MPFGKEVKFKAGRMKKEVHWTVYPPDRTANQENPTLLVQSDHRIMLIDINSKTGWLSKHKANYSTFADTLPQMGATKVEVSQDIIDRCIEAQQSANSNRVIGNMNISTGDIVAETLIMGENTFNDEVNFN